MTDKRMELRNSIKRLANWEHLAATAEDAWDQDPLNEDLEWAFNHYQDLRWHEFLFAAHLIYTIADGRLTEKESRSMARDKAARERFAEII